MQDFTKILFVVFFYSAVFPSGFFFGFLILITQYYMDKFSLVRMWQPTPRLGADLADFSRKYFFTFTVVAFAVVSSFTWAQYPYDKLCEPLDSSTTTVGVYKNVQRLDGEKVKIWEGAAQIEVDELEVGDETDYVACGQNFRSWAGFPLPATPRVQTGSRAWFATVSEDDLTWMSDQQVCMQCFRQLFPSSSQLRSLCPLGCKGNFHAHLRMVSNYNTAIIDIWFVW